MYEKKVLFYNYAKHDYCQIFFDSMKHMTVKSFF